MLSARDKVRVLVAGRSQPALRGLQELLAERVELACTFKLINNGHTDPLHGIDVTPDVVLPALHPSRVAALRAVVEAHDGSVDRAAWDVAQASPALTNPAARDEHRDQGHSAEVDLFADC